MRAICVMKMLLMVGLVADVGPAFAIEDGAQGRPQNSVRSQRSQDRYVEGLKFPEVMRTRTVVANAANEVFSAELFATDRSAAFAPLVFAASPFTPRSIDGRFDDGFTAYDQQRSIGLLHRQIAAARMRSAGDVWLMALVGVMLVAYQLCRKHRFLRPQPFAL